ncbi:transposase [Nocardiopsis kunsanensis]|uniref:Transposase n=1 Tax=Nocardiopsis kunsanensis TaxID=141693 RepID=A0A918XBY4_9ACTN|nr:IS3 family transposase [Nocardiopsis kunsanensis]GHD24948.1 transposase [Nocardiopsis kunsanensis]
MATLKDQHPLAMLLQVAGLARSTYFYHRARRGRPDPQAGLKAAVTDAFDGARGRYGHRRVHAVLYRQGWRVAKKTVLKLMGELGLVCRVRRRRTYNSYRGRVGRVADNVLERDFTAQAPHSKWVTDVSEFRVGGEKVYLSPVIDLFDRSVVAHSVSLSPSLELTNSSLSKALAQVERGRAPLVHSDQGFQYQHLSWRNLLDAAGAVQSMSRKGNCLDNAVAENFFSHLKEELFHRERFETVEDFIQALDEYIGWYNTTRISTALQGLSPVEYRAQALAA